MLGRSAAMFPHFRLTTSVEGLVQWAGLSPSQLPPLRVVRHDVFPTVHPVLRLCPTAGKRVMSSMRLGLIPSYAHDEHCAERMTEAHAEALTTSASFRSAFQRRRCLVPATAFHEARQEEADRPSSFGLDTDEVFAIAGVWESWKAEDGRVVDTFALIEVLPDRHLRCVFDRMPVVIRREDRERWLEGPGLPLDLLKALSPADLRVWKMMPYLELPSLEAKVG